MVAGFELETQKLTEQEKKLLPGLCGALNRRIGKKNAITNKEMIDAYAQMDVHISAARIRKLINHIRVTGKVKNLVATSNGYYVAIDPTEIEKYKISLLQRANAILAVAKTFD